MRHQSSCGSIKFFAEIWQIALLSSSDETNLKHGPTETPHPPPPTLYVLLGRLNPFKHECKSVANVKSGSPYQFQMANSSTSLIAEQPVHLSSVPGTLAKRRGWISRRSGVEHGSLSIHALGTDKTILDTVIFDINS